MSFIYLIFKITNLDSNKIYIGYYSGKSEKQIRIKNKELLNDIKKLGKGLFKKEILYYFNSSGEMLEKYKILVNKDFKLREDTYNFYNLNPNCFSTIDSSGNIIKISKNDALFFKGNVFHKNNNKVIVKDVLGNTFRVDKNDPRYLCGELMSVNKGKIIVKDFKNNIISVDKNDPRYLCRELKGVQKNKVTVSDSSGNTFSVDRNDPRYLSGELVSINKGKIVVFNDNKFIQIDINDFYNNRNNYNLFSQNKVSIIDSSGNIFSVDKNDPRYLSGELVSINKGKINVKDTSGNIYKINKDDSRFLSGEFKSISKGKVNVTDGNMIIRVDCNGVPKHFHYLSLKQKSIEKLKITKNDIFIKKLSTRYNLNITNKNNNYIEITNYCNHNKILLIKYEELKKYFKLNKKDINFLLCDECINEKIKNILDNNEIKITKDKLKNILMQKSTKYSYFFNKNFLKKYFPLILKEINNYALKYNISDLYEKIFIYAYDIEINKCCVSKCNNNRFFSKSYKQYNLYCKEHINYIFRSNKEQEIFDFINENYKDNIVQTYKKLGKEIDIYIPDKKLAIEFNGLYWHSDIFKDNKYHYNKWKLCKNNGVKLLSIWEDDWQYKKDIIKSIILCNLNLIKNKIYARRCIIKEVKDSKKFLNLNHLQGWCNSTINLGLFYNGELVSLMTFNKINSHKKIQFELLRFCDKINTNIIGSASKLFKYFISHYNNDIEIIGYSNCDISCGDLYKQLGFKEIYHTRINYWWVKDKRYNKLLFTKKILIKQGFDPNKTVDEIMRERRYNKIWDTGKLFFKYIN